MAKVTDLNELNDSIRKLLNQDDWEILEYCTLNEATLIVQNIYITNDQMKGFGQNLLGGISIISSEKRISVIHDGCASSYKNTFPICGYEDFMEDITSILITIDAAIVRMNYAT